MSVHFVHFVHPTKDLFVINYLGMGDRDGWGMEGTKSGIKGG
jgi:hypothetical protein